MNGRVLPGYVPEELFTSLKPLDGVELVPTRSQSQPITIGCSVIWVDGTSTELIFWELTVADGIKQRSWFETYIFERENIAQKFPENNLFRLQMKNFKLNNFFYETLGGVNIDIFKLDLSLVLLNKTDPIYQYL